MAGHHGGTPRKKKFRLSPSARRVMITVLWDCEGVILLDVMQRDTTVNSDAYISALRKMKRFQCLWPDKKLGKMLLQHNNTRPCTTVKTRKPSHKPGGRFYRFHPIAQTFSTRRFSPLWTPEKCCAWEKIWDGWCCGQYCQNLVMSKGQGMVPVRHTFPRSTLAQSYRTVWRFCRKWGYINSGSVNMYYFQNSQTNIQRKIKCGALLFGHPSYELWQNI